MHNMRCIRQVNEKYFPFLHNFIEIMILAFWGFAGRKSRAILMVGWLVVLRIDVDLAIFQPYLDLEAGDNQSLKIQVARPGIEPRSSCSASQELNYSATATPRNINGNER